MWEACYGKEPFDLRLTVLRMIRQWKKLLLITLAGSLIFGGIYYLGNTLLRGRREYAAGSVYRVDYGVDDVDANTVMINSYTWNTYMHTEEFLDMVRSRLAGSGMEEISDQELGGYIQGEIESDWRVPSTGVITEDRNKSTVIARAVEEAVIQDFVLGISEIKAIRVLDHAGEAQEILPELRIGRAFALGAVLAAFFGLVILLLKELGEDNIWLPAVIRRRYGVKVAGTLNSRELKENICYLFAGADHPVVCSVQENCDPAETAEAIRRLCEGTAAGEADWQSLPSPLACPETAEKLRAADGILLAVRAGAHGGKQLEYTLDFLAQQDCKVTAAILLDADEVLLRLYYGFQKTDGRAWVEE